MNASVPRNGIETRDPARMRHTRVADRLVIHGEPIDFRELCRRTVPPHTRYLVLDLDRTLHLGRNMGELLGWEVAAYLAYGGERLAEAEPRRRPDRFFLDWRRPLALLRYLLIGVRMWTVPGLFYLFCGKLPGSFEIGRRWTFRAFGTDPVAAVQSVPQTALLHHLGRIPAAELRLLARRVWQRHGGDQVIERDDLDWLRTRCPGIRVVLSSASPQPMLEVAAEALGVDAWLSSTLEEHGGWYSTPFQLHPTLSRRLPRRLSGPRETRINASRVKIENLRARFPDLSDPATVSVGMTDTGYGEDHCWTGQFTHVVDVNSTAPFPPLVAAASPLREVHSAEVLTRTERARRAAGEPGWKDPRRPPRHPRDRTFTAADISAALGGMADELERLAQDLDARAQDLATPHRGAARRSQALMERIEELVRAFNDAPAANRRALLARLRRELRAERRLRRARVRLDRPLAELTCSMAALLSASRRTLGGADDARGPSSAAG